jgi:hypothetical protein
MGLGGRDAYRRAGRAVPDECPDGAKLVAIPGLGGDQHAGRRYGMDLELMNRRSSGAEASSMGNDRSLQTYVGGF